MLKYELVENTAQAVTYRYFPDGGATFGTLTVSKRDNSVLKEDVADNDSYRLYFVKMYKRIKEFTESNTFKDKGIIAWY